VAPRACVRVYARVLVPPNLYIHTYIQRETGGATALVRASSCARMPSLGHTRRRRRDTTTVLEKRFNVGYIAPVRATFCALPAPRPAPFLLQRVVTSINIIIMIE